MKRFRSFHRLVGVAPHSPAPHVQCSVPRRSSPEHRVAPNAITMTTRQRCCIFAAGRLRRAPAVAARSKSSSSPRLIPRLDGQCQQQLQLHPPSTPPPPPPLLTTFARGSPPPVTARITRIARHDCSCSNRQDIRLGNRSFSALVRPPSTGTREGVQQHTEPEKNDSKRGGRQRVVVGMSGGVDSSVVAMLLQQQASVNLLCPRKRLGGWSLSVRQYASFVRR